MWQMRSQSSGILCRIGLGRLDNAAQKLGITYYDLPKTQAVKRDLALLIDTSVTMADIEK